MPRYSLAMIALLAMSQAALAQPTARASGTVNVHAGPDNRYEVIGQLADGTEVTLEYCTQTDSDSDRGGIGMGGHVLWPAGSTQWCKITDYGWVTYGSIVGEAAKIHVTPPDFAGPGW
ncbi:MAG: SH3 domain-containing protein [Devosia sp.]|uniref:SH3 domain-containing protein n=1 Tax=Devosia sp. TaxID=1871048 RepID=UPI0024C6E16A|nr:SH3 domain-containing protein [Devosia sp.]UYO00992.1 MAG: SH3 domain-containing protein [Devosia sp.]